MSEIEGLIVPPHSIEAEQAVLGGLLLSNSAWDRIGDMVSESDFYRLDHRLIWNAIARQIENNKPADVLTVSDSLKAAAKLQDAGGLAYLHQISSSTPSAANIRRYAEIVREKAQRRALIETAIRFQDQAYANTGEPIGEIIDRAQSEMISLSARRSDRESEGIASVLSRVMESIDARHRGQDHRIPTGLIDLDRLLHGGLRAGRLYVIAGRPSSGKSALSLQLGLHAALTGHPTMVASLEMADEENGERAIASMAKVELDRVITGQLETEHWDRLGTAIGELNQAPIYFDDSPAVTLNQLRARARRQRQRHGIQLLIVDYLQLMSVDAKGENRNQDVAEIAEGLKALAKEIGIAVIALSQMNRDCERRTNRRGIVADLRDSGGIDAAADVIAFVYREEMYDETTPAKGVAEIIVRKARHAKTGTVYTFFRGEFARFESVAAGYSPEYLPAKKTRPLGPVRRSFQETEA